MSCERNRRQKVVFLKASIIAAQKHLQVQPQTQLDIRSFFYLLKVLKRLRKLNTLHRDFPVPSLNNNNTMICWWKDSSWSFDYVFKFLKLHFTYSMIFWIHAECRFFMKPIVAWQLCCAMIEHYTIDIFSLTVLYELSTHHFVLRFLHFSIIFISCNIQILQCWQMKNLL